MAAVLKNSSRFINFARKTCAVGTVVGGLAGFGIGLAGAIGGAQDFKKTHSDSTEKIFYTVVSLGIISCTTMIGTALGAAAPISVPVGLLVYSATNPPSVEGVKQ